MKKVILNLTAIAFVSMMLTSCGGSPESDAKKMAELMCEVQKLAKAGADGDEDAMTKAKELGEEFEALAKELEAKYKDNKDAEKEIEEAFKKAVEACGGESF